MKRIPGLFLLILLAMPTFAQPSPADLVPQRLYVQAADLGSEAGALTTLVEYLRLELIGRTRTTPAQQASDAEVMVSVASRQQGASHTVSIRAVNINNQGITASHEYTANSLDIGQNLEQLRAAAAKINLAFPPLPPRIVEVVTERVITETQTLTVTRGTKLTLRAAPGTIIAQSGKPNLAVPEEGFLEYELAAQTTFRYTASFPGYFPLERNLFIETEDLEDNIVLEPLRRLEISGTLRYLSLVPSIGVHWFFKPGQHYLGISLENSFLHPVRVINDGVDYLDLQIQLGTRLGKPASRFRLGGSLALAGRVDVGEGYLRFSDWAAFSVLLTADLELRLTPRWAILTGIPVRLHTVNAQYGNSENTVWFETYDTGTIPFMYDMPAGVYLSPDWFLAAPEFILGLRFEL